MNPALLEREYCPKCEGDGSCSEMAPCTTFDKDCACNFSRVSVDPCPVCSGSGYANPAPGEARCVVCKEPIALGEMFHVVPEDEATPIGLSGGHFHARCLPRELENLDAAS